MSTPRQPLLPPTRLPGRRFTDPGRSQNGRALPTSLWGSAVQLDAAPEGHVAADLPDPGKRLRVCPGGVPALLSARLDGVVAREALPGADGAHPGGRQVVPVDAIGREVVVA